MNSKPFISAIVVAMSVACCTNNVSDTSKQPSDSTPKQATVVDTQSTAAPVETPKKELVTNWEKPLYTLDEKGDTVEVWRYNEKGLLVKYIRGKDIFNYSYDGCKVTETMIFEGSDPIVNVSVYSDETHKKLIGYNNKMFDLSKDGKVLVSYKDGRTWRHSYDEQGRILKIVADPMEETEDEAFEYTYGNDGSTTIADFSGYVKRDSLNRNVKSEGDCSETVHSYEGNCGTSATKPVGECAGVDENGNIDGKPAPVTKHFTYYAQE